MKLIDADAFALNKAFITNILSGQGEYWDGYIAALDRVSDALISAPTVDAAPVAHAKWEWFEEWNPSTSDHPKECDDCGWRCGHCKTSLADMVGGYWDDFYETPKLSYCPNCGAKMDGDTNG